MENDFDTELMKIIELEVENGKKKAEKICKKNAKELAEKLQQNSPSNTGYYAKGWKAKKTYDNINSTEYSTVNTSKQATLSWLLENGHIAADGKRVGKRPHIKANAEEQIDNFVKEMTEAFDNE